MKEYHIEQTKNPVGGDTIVSANCVPFGSLYAGLGISLQWINSNSEIYIVRMD